MFLRFQLWNRMRRSSGRLSYFETEPSFAVETRDERNCESSSRQSGHAMFTMFGRIPTDCGRVSVYGANAGRDMERVMEIFRELSVSTDADRMASAVPQMESSLPSGWARNLELERDIRSSPFGTKPAYCFTCAAHEGLPAATLVLAQKDPGTFFVSNIIPTSKHQLSYREYNSILEEFFERALRPSSERCGLTAVMTEAQADLDHWMSPVTAEKLRAFSACANRSTGAAHPSDRERWNDFVLSAYQDSSRMDAPTLKRWLVEVDGWAPEVADQLALEYAYGRELLTFAEEHRRSA